MERFEIRDLQQQQKDSGRPYLEFMRVPALSMGMYCLLAGSKDPQQPHQEDETYYIVSGRGRIQVADESQPVQAGTIIYVSAGVPHHFYNIQEDLTILVFFPPPKVELNFMEYDTLPRNYVRRSDRAVEDEAWIRALLHRAPAGYLATVDDDQPFINANLFVYDEERNTIYLHTARKGRTRSNVEESENVCFLVAEMGRLLPANVALEFSVEYQSVTVFGRAAVLEDETEATRALQLLLDKYFPHLQPGRDYRPPIAEELKRTAVYAVAIEDWGGKRKQVAADFPGALFYPQSENGYRPV